MAELSEQDRLVLDEDRDGVADPGDILEYTIGIGNFTGADLTNVELTDPLGDVDLVPNTLNISPLAFDDEYTTIGNITLRTRRGGFSRRAGSPSRPMASSSNRRSASSSSGLAAGLLKTVANKFLICHLGIAPDLAPLLFGAMVAWLLWATLRHTAHRLAARSRPLGAAWTVLLVVVQLKLTNAVLRSML